MAKTIIIYTTKTCGFCKATKDFLQQNNLSYQEIDVGSSQEKAREMIEKSGQMGVPVTVIKDGEEEELIVGFDQERLGEVLGVT